MATETGDYALADITPALLVRYRTTLAEDHANATVNRYLAVLSHAVTGNVPVFELSDDLATRVTAVFYSDAREAFIKAMADA